MSRGRTSSAMQRFRARAALRIRASRSGFIRVRVCFLSAQVSAVMVPLPGKARPMTSPRQFMELAVNMPEQDPVPGQARWASARSCFSEVFPTACLPTPSKTVMRSVRLQPASMGPPDT